MKYRAVADLLRVGFTRITRSTGLIPRMADTLPIIAGAMNVSAWGDSEQRWVGQQTETPTWDDGTGWYESQSDSEAGTTELPHERWARRSD